MKVKHFFECPALWYSFIITKIKNLSNAREWSKLIVRIKIDAAWSRQVKINFSKILMHFESMR